MRTSFAALAIVVATSACAQLSGTGVPDVMLDSEHTSPARGNPAPQRNDMHACARQTLPAPTSFIMGGVVTGVRVDRNELICAGGFRMGVEIPRVGAQPSNPTLVQCPANHYVTGVRADRKEASCAQILGSNSAPASLANPTPDPASSAAPITVRQDMHACPRGSGLVGYDTSTPAWTLLCAPFPICWGGAIAGGTPPPTPCPNRCSLPVGNAYRQGVCT